MRIEYSNIHVYQYMHHGGRTTVAQCKLLTRSPPSYSARSQSCPALCIIHVRMHTYMCNCNTIKLTAVMTCNCIDTTKLNTVITIYKLTYIIIK